MNKVGEMEIERGHACGCVFAQTKSRQISLARLRAAMLLRTHFTSHAIVNHGVCGAAMSVLAGILGTSDYSQEARIVDLGVYGLWFRGLLRIDTPPTRRRRESRTWWQAWILKTCMKWRHLSL